MITAQETWDRPSSSGTTRTWSARTVAGGLENTGRLSSTREGGGHRSLDRRRCSDEPPSAGDPRGSAARRRRRRVIGSEVLLREDLPVEEPAQSRIEARAIRRRSRYDRGHAKELPGSPSSRCSSTSSTSTTTRTGTGFRSTRPSRPRGVARPDARVRPGQARSGVRGRLAVGRRRRRRGDRQSGERGALLPEFVSWARLNDVRYTYFPSMNPEGALRGPQGAHWGDRDRDGV